MGIREALGLPEVGVDGLAPTLRSGFTGPRNSTSVLNSVASQRMWAELRIWPNGVAPSREEASLFVAKDHHFRMAVQDCALMQGFPSDWIFAGSVYKALGQIGNSVAPPVAYPVAKAVASALLRLSESL
jgi:DNA (cytosine-5)-methyltransferase 1